MLLWAAQSIRSWLEHGSREPSCGSLISEWRLHRDLCIYTGGVAQGKPGILPGRWPILTAPLLISWGEARHRAHHHLALALVPSSLSFQSCPPHHKHFRQISSSGNEASLKRWVSAPEAVTLHLEVLLLPEVRVGLLSLSSEIPTHKFNFKLFRVFKQLVSEYLWVGEGVLALMEGDLCPWKLFFGKRLAQANRQRSKWPYCSYLLTGSALGRLKLALTTWPRHAFLFFSFHTNRE